MSRYNRWFSLTNTQKQNIVDSKDGWIIINLLKYNNCLIPNNIVKKYGIRHIERRLSSIIGEKVKIDTRMVDYLGKTYIAEVKI